MFDRIKRWFSDKTPDPRTLVRNTVEHDAFDRDDLTEVMGAMGALQRARQNLQDASPVGGELLDDLAFSMMRVRPKLADQETVDAAHQPNWQVMSNAMDLPDWHRLHAETKGDPWFAGMAASALAPTVLELASRNEDAQKQANELDGTMQTLAGAEAEQQTIEEQLQSLTPGTVEADAAQQQLDDLAAQIDQLSQQGQAQAADLDRSLTMSSLEVSAAMQEAIGKAADQVSDEKAMCALWRTDPGELQRMSADEHMKLAGRLDNEKLRDMAKLWGAMKYDVAGARSQKSRYTRDEMYSIEQGNDLSRVLPSELVKLKHPVRKLEFYRDFTEARLMQYELRGEEKQAHGGIYLLEDGSGSMKGQRELFAKVTGMHSMDIARQEDRAFVGIMFGGTGQFETFRFDTAADYTTDRMLEWAETFINSGGTCFQTPLDEALRMLGEEFDATGATSGDIILVTDGEAAVSPEWYEHFQSEKKRLGFKVYGIQVAGGFGLYDLGLEALVDAPITTVADLFSAKDTRSIFAAI